MKLFNFLIKINDNETKINLITNKDDCRLKRILMEYDDLFMKSKWDIGIMNMDKKGSYKD